MAETAATTRPVRTRAARTTTKAPAKAAAAKVAPAKAAPAATGAPSDDGRERYGFVCDHPGDTKSYAKFTPPASSGCVGTLYVPLGTEEVKVLLIGPEGVVSPE